MKFRKTSVKRLDYRSPHYQDDMIKPFDFAADGRTYSCTIEERRGTAGEFWWWFSVTGDTSSYAPFQAFSGDTRTSVQERVLQFYRHRCARRAEPSVRGGQWGRRPPQPAVQLGTQLPMPAPKTTS